MAIVSRLQLDHPALGTTGGAGLHTAIENIYKKIGDNVSTRILVAVNVNDAATAVLTHDFKTAFANLRLQLYLYDETTTELTAVTKTSSPSISQFTIAANGTNPTTQIDVTNNSGAQRDLALVAIVDPFELDEITDVDLASTAPEDGQALVYEGSSGLWKPGASGDASLKIQGVTDPNATIKGGYLILDDGREIATYDGTGSASTDYGKDLAVNLDTILGSNPADATTYHLYVDLETLGAAVTLTDNGRKVIGVQQANFVLSTTAPDAINRARYVPCGFLRSATTGTVWSGTGSAFGTFAMRRHANGPLAVSPVVFRLDKQAVGTVGSSGQIKAGHVLSTKSFPASVASANRSWYALTSGGSASGTDGSGNARSLTASGTPATAAGIFGAAGTAAVFDGTDDVFSSTDSFFGINPTTTAFSMGGWFRANDWTPGATQNLMTLGAAELVADILLDGTNVLFRQNAVAAQGVSVAAASIADNTWHHVAIAMTTTEMRAYFDGVLVGTVVRTASSDTAAFRVGRRNSAADRFFAGRAQEIFFVSGTALSSEDIRKLYAYRQDHARSVQAKNQLWAANLYTQVATQDGGWLVDMSDADSVFWDFSALASTDQAEVLMQDLGLAPAVVPAAVTFDQTYTSNPTFPINHGQAGVPEIVIMQEVATGEWEVVDSTGQVTVTATQLLGSLASYFTGGATKVRVIARPAPASPTGVSRATASLPGIMSSYVPVVTASVLAVSANHTIGASDGVETVLATTGGGGITSTLPPVASSAGRKLTFKKVDSGAGALTIDGNASETIDGATTAAISTQYAAMTLVCDGSAWHIL